QHRPRRKAEPNVAAYALMFIPIVVVILAILTPHHAVAVTAGGVVGLQLIICARYYYVQRVRIEEPDFREPSRSTCASCGAGNLRLLGVRPFGSWFYECSSCHVRLKIIPGGIWKEVSEPADLTRCHRWSQAGHWLGAPDPVRDGLDRSGTVGALIRIKD